jgi:hypothetical protein
MIDQPTGQWGYHVQLNRFLQRASPKFRVKTCPRNAPQDAIGPVQANPSLTQALALSQFG